ncbi:hypothetical protein, partial [Roseibium algae]
SACLNTAMICASLYRPFFIKNLLRYLAEKILLLNTTNFRGDYRGILRYSLCDSVTGQAFRLRAGIGEDSPRSKAIKPWDEDGPGG